MAMRPRARWLLLGVALVLTLVGARLVGREDEGLPPAATPARATAGDRVDERLELDLDRLAGRKGGAPAGDPFRAFSWQSVVEAEARKNAPPPPPPRPPQAPPLPFTYMGKLIEEGRIVVFLTQGDRNYIVRQGDTIDGTYRVDAVTEESLSLTYLPLKQKQQFDLGGAQ
ncbi:MAG TPA: hypothetical protein VLD36_21800 [Burkholderiales bacterium]|nr:hypothetical protein [Burkholderiales bacterium]